MLHKKIDSTYKTGMFFLVLSTGFFCLPFWVKLSENELTTFFVINYIFTVLFLVIKQKSRKVVAAENRLHHHILYLLVALVTCYSLNRVVRLFHDSTTWFSILLVSVSLNYLSFAFFETMPKWWRHLASFINGIALVSFTYLAIYLLPAYGVGLLGAFLLGFSLLCFVPALFVYYTIKLQMQAAGNVRRFWLSFSGGCIAALFLIIAFAAQWQMAKRKIEKAWAAATVTTSDLPDWVKMSQRLPRDAMSTKVMAAGTIYSVPEPNQNILNLAFIDARDGDQKHDPLVMIAIFFSGDLDIDPWDRERVMNLSSNTQHERLARLWSGSDLQTTNVRTNVQVWPDCNIAYTEKLVTVANKSERWSGQQEGIYSFYLPEGGFVSSLSLWVDGKEEKARLTSAALADSAYKTIVGVERRDPSVAKWQEGNRVSVRVFPVNSNESRMFKIGFTSPMQRLEGKLRYEDIYFEGPSFADAMDEVVVSFEQPVAGQRLPASFAAQGKQLYTHKGNYKSGWSLLIDDPGLANCQFSFNNSTYSLSAYHQQLMPALFEEVYLDLNSSWTRREYEDVLNCTNAIPVYVYDTSLVMVSDSNKETIWEKGHANHFSLFPFYLIQKPKGALVISKSGTVTPHMDKLGENLFLKKTRDFLASTEPVKLFNLSNSLSNYLASLKEKRAFQYEKGEVNDVKHLLQKGFFTADQENNKQVLIEPSQMLINKVPGMVSSTGPDHLMRMFAYNHVMKQLGRGLLTNLPVGDSIVQEAARANVVTPVSSLVVLETQKDYERFDIKETPNSLGNAALGSKGAVPEPHEWALIFLVCGMVVYLIRKKKMKYAQ